MAGRLGAVAVPADGAGVPIGVPGSQLPSPKEKLFDALREASELPARRRRAFHVEQARTRIVDFIADFSPLQELPSFRRFEEDVTRLCAERDWA